MRQLHVAHHLELRAHGQAQSRGVEAGAVTQPDEALGLVESHPIPDPVAQMPGDQRGIIGKPSRRVAMTPSTLVEKNRGVIPMEQSAERPDARLEQAVDQSVVEIQSAGIDLASPPREQARPGKGEAVGLQPQILHQPDIVAVAVVVVAGGPAVVALPHLVGRAAKAVPDGRPAAVLVRGPLDLVGRSGGTPEKVRREGTMLGDGTQGRSTSGPILAGPGPVELRKTICGSTRM